MYQSDAYFQIGNSGKNACENTHNAKAIKANMFCSIVLLFSLFSTTTFPILQYIEVQLSTFFCLSRAKNGAKLQCRVSTPSYILSARFILDKCSQELKIQKGLKILIRQWDNFIKLFKVLSVSNFCTFTVHEQIILFFGLRVFSRLRHKIFFKACSHM